MRTIAVSLAAAALVLPLPCQKTNPTPAAPPTQEIDYAGFREAYEQAEAPQIVVVCGLAAPSTSEQPGDKAFRVFDSSGDTDVLRSAIERALLNADVDVVSPQELDAAQKRQIQALVNQGDAPGAIRQMQTLLKAEVAISVWMLPRHGSYRVTVDTTSLSRGTKIGTFAFDWKLGTSAAEIKYYGQVMCRRLFDDFIRNYGRGNPAGQRFNVELFGVEDARQMKQIETAMEGIDGMKRVRSTGMTRDGSENLARFRVQFTGSRIDLMAAMEEIGSKILGGECRVADGVGEAIVLRTAPAARPAPQPPGSAQTHSMVVTLSNAKTQQDVFDVIDSFKKVLDIDGTFEKYEGEGEAGVGTFKIRFTTSREDVIKRLQELAPGLPFEVVATEPDSISLELK